MALVVARDVIDKLLGEAARHHPAECCGLLLGADMIEEVVPIPNVAIDPRRHFEIDPAALIAAHKAARGGGPAIAGYYHSHPAGLAAPSVTDQASAAGDGLVWAIVAGQGVNFWRDGREGFEALSYELAGG